MSESDRAHKPMPDASVSAQQGDNIAHALAGAGGGLLSVALTYPLITLSTRAQVESKRAQSSTYDAVRRIVQREGISGLYSGLDSALFGISVTNFVYYYWYEWTRSYLERAAVRTARASTKLTMLESMLAGAIAARASESSSSPSSSTSSLPALGTQPHSPPKKPSTISTVMALWKDEGPLALFAGVLPALVLVINPILQYTIFEQLKDVLEKRRRVTPRDVFVLGALGRLLATSITYPYITVKSRMHVAKRSSDGKEEGMDAALTRIVREKGWSGLYKGIGPKVSQSVITAAFLFAFKDLLYEMSVRLRQRVPKVIKKA
ncbi:hypothetical protein MMC21_006290 [Puttea exsequens]|nr:hypothetical protein [Puttea exsequens]